MELAWLRVHCPYCGEVFETAIDPGAGDDVTVEDCAICCRPITLSIRLDDDGAVIGTPRRDDDTG